MVGGIVTSSILELLIYPAIYVLLEMVERSAAAHAGANDRRPLRAHEFFITRPRVLVTGAAAAAGSSGGMSDDVIEKDGRDQRHTASAWMARLSSMLRFNRGRARLSVDMPRTACRPRPAKITAGSAYQTAARDADDGSEATRAVTASPR